VRARRRLFVAVALVASLACGGQAPPPEDGPAVEAVAAGAEAVADVEGETPPVATPLRPVRVRVYFPSAEATELVAEPRDIFDTVSPVDRAKQILSDLIGGPEEQAAIPAMLRSVRLRQVYVLDDGTAYADFSSELRDLSGGGSAQELLTVFAIVNSLALNVREIVRVGILIDGVEVDTLSGHLDLRRPLAPRTDLIAERYR
jgi:hypothetical protein